MPSSAPSTPPLCALSLHDALPISASEREHPDLLWALRGGGGNFGVVTSLEYRLHDVDQVYAGPIFYELENAGDLFRMYREFIADARSEEHTSELQSRPHLVCRLLLPRHPRSALFPYTTLFRSPHPSANTRTSSGRFAAAAATSASSPRSSTASTTSTRSTPGRSSMSSRTPATCSACIASSSPMRDRKSTRLNSSHVRISYAVFCSLDTPALRSFPTRRSSDLRIRARTPGPPLGASRRRRQLRRRHLARVPPPRRRPGLRRADLL